jgi:hypothetical protein
MTPGEFTAALHAARHPTQDPAERARALGTILGLKGCAVEVLEEALNAQADIARSLGVEDACGACVYRGI